jgi:hypothetical protein
MSSPRSWPPAGLLLVIFSLVRSGRIERAPAAVGAYIGAAYWFASSTSFANPAITIGRMSSDTFAGIAPASAPLFVAMQLVDAVAAVLLIRVLYPEPSQARRSTSSTITSTMRFCRTRSPTPRRHATERLNAVRGWAR